MLKEALKNTENQRRRNSKRLRLLPCQAKLKSLQDVVDYDTLNRFVFNSFAKVWSPEYITLMTTTVKSYPSS